MLSRVVPTWFHLAGDVALLQNALVCDVPLAQSFGPFSDFHNNLELYQDVCVRKLEAKYGSTFGAWLDLPRPHLNYRSLRYHYILHDDVL